MQHFLNLSYLDNRVRELGLKRWWLADQLRVDPKTVTRWFTGNVKSIKDENLVNLAKILRCNPKELTIKDSTEAFASKKDQEVAAKLIEQEDLIHVLAPSGKWPLLESLIKATLKPDLPLPLLGALYNHLAIASWRQSKFKEAEAYAHKAHDIGKQVRNLAVEVQAKLSFGTICSFTGRLKEAQKYFEFVITRKAYLDEERQYASALNNLAAVHHQRGDFALAIQTQRQANAVFKKHGTPMGRSIGWSGLAMSLIEIEAFDKARAACKTSRRIAEDCGHKVGVAFNDVLLADIAARKDDFQNANRLLTSGLNTIEAMNIKEPVYYVYAARVRRLQGDANSAKRFIAKGLACSASYPVDRADLFIEHWRLDGDEKHLAVAKEIYLATGAEGRLRVLAKG